MDEARNRIQGAHMRKLLSGEQNEGQKATFRLLACWPVGKFAVNQFEMVT